MPKQVLDDAAAVFGRRFLSVYGMTESCCVGTVLSSRDFAGDEALVERLAMSAGRPMPLTELRVVDEDLNDIPWGSGRHGEILLRTETLISAYWKNPEATSRAFTDGWFRSGDVGVMDQDGYVFIVDRKNDMIISGGANVYPREVEDVLHRHPGVQLVGVVGLPDPKWGEAVAAFVQCKVGQAVREDELRAIANESLGSYKRPKVYHFVETLPLTGLGKVSRKELRAPFWTSSRG
jgi:acyl-CoA synthetase (AMP-forming)/AMP-acid ligase II